RFAHWDPADVVVLMVVPRHIAADRAHQEELDDLVHALTGQGEPVLDLADGPNDLDLESRLLADLAQRGLFDALAQVGRALREDPRAVGLTSRKHYFEPARALAHDDAAGGHGVTNAGCAAGARRRHEGTSPNCNSAYG